MQWLPADLHLHTNFSDGKLSVREVVDLHGKAGFKAIAITDHVAEAHTFFGKIAHRLSYTVSRASFQKYLDEVRREAERADREYGMRVLFGYEISKNSLANDRSAHVLIIGNEKLISADRPVEEILLEARSENALTIAAHPFHTGELEFQSFHLWSRREKLAPLVDAWETSYRKKMVHEVYNSGLPLIASSDFHHPKHFEAWKSLIGVAVDNGTPSQADIFAAVRERRVRFFYDQGHQEILPRRFFFSDAICLD